MLNRVALLAVQWALSMALLVALWQWVLVPSTSRGFVPTPLSTWDHIAHIFRDGSVWSMLSITLEEAGVGFAIGLLVGIVVALVIGVAPPLVGRVIEPVVVGIYAAPNFVLAPFLYVLLGSGIVPRATMVFFAVFPVVAIYSVTGLRTADPDVVVALRLFGANRRQMARKFFLPQMLSYLQTAMLWLLPTALTIAIGAEIFFSAMGGLGGVLYQASLVFEPAQVFGPLVIATVLAAVLLAASRGMRERMESRIGSGSERGVDLRRL